MIFLSTGQLLNLRLVVNASTPIPHSRNASRRKRKTSSFLGIPGMQLKQLVSASSLTNPWFLQCKEYNAGRLQKFTHNVEKNQLTLPTQKCWWGSSPPAPWTGPRPWRISCTAPPPSAGRWPRLSWSAPPAVAASPTSSRPKPRPQCSAANLPPTTTSPSTRARPLTKRNYESQSNTLWVVRSVVMFCKTFLTCSTNRWVDTVTNVQPNL